MAGFQTQVGIRPAPAVEGDFASANPRSTFLAGPSGLVSGPNGLYVGRFAWASSRRLDGDSAPAEANNYGSGPPQGFVHREMQALITTFLSQSGLLIPPGLAVTLHNSGDFWVRNNGTVAAVPGMKAYANLANGLASFAAAGSPSSGTVTGTIAAGTASFTALISGNVMTVSAIGTGTIYPGSSLSGTGVAAGTKIVGQISGTTGGVGTYAVNPPNQTVASTTISSTYGLMTVTALGTGTVGIGDPVSGTGVTAGSTVTALGTGTGGTGTYIVDPTQTVGSTTLTLGTSSETLWYATSAGLVGELVKISRINPFGG